MKAMRLHGPSDIRLEEMPRPQIRPDQVLVRVSSVGICGSDLHYFLDGHIGDTVATEPLILGHEFAGEIVEIGEEARRHKHLRVGQMVAVDPAVPCGECEYCEEGNSNLCPAVTFCGTPPTDGALQEFIAWPGNLVYPLPESMSAETGAVLEAMGVALHAINLAKIRLADKIAVLGVGPIGLLIVKLAKLSGATEIYATDPRPARREMALRLGADAAFDPGQCDVVAEIKRRTGGRGVDVSFEVAGVLETPQQAVDSLMPGGTVVVVGICPDDRIPIKSTAARRKGVTIKLCRRMKHVYPRSIDLVSHGLVDLQTIVSHRFGLEDVAEAFRVANDPTSGALKVVVNL